MTQDTKRKLPAGKIALASAALVAALTVGYAISRDKPSTESATAVVDPQAGSIEALEKAAQANPKDPAAWAALGFATFAEGKFEDAVRAYDKASTLDPKKAVLWAALGEARVMASEKDPMPAAAVTAFEKAIALDPKDPRARYFLAVKKDLGGDHSGAIDDWLALLEDSPADAPWRSDLVRTIEQVGKMNSIDVAPRLAAADKKSPAPAAPPAIPMVAKAIPGPSAEDLRNASSIPPSEQRAMAEGMVSRLEARLQGDPGNVDGWLMLMRSRMSLNEPDKASAALKTAIAANPDRAADLRKQAAMLGVR